MEGQSGIFHGGRELIRIILLFLWAEKAGLPGFLIACPRYL